MNRTRKDGFSLMELLVAMSIFTMIVLMMSTIYHQSSVAWDSGSRKAQGGMEVRALMGFISRELEQAVAFKGALGAGQWPNPMGTAISFVTLAGEPIGGRRQATLIDYQMSGNSLIRKAYQFDAASGTPYDDINAYNSANWLALGQPTILATNVAEITFAPFPVGTPRTRLPRWMRIRIGVDRLHDVSGVGARSAGPDLVFDTADDIRSY